MKVKLVVLLAIVLLGASACSDDDSEMEDPCAPACNRLAVCGMDVVCSGAELTVSQCAGFCRQRQAVGAANCILGVQSCTEIDQLSTCASQMPCM